MAMTTAFGWVPTVSGRHSFDSFGHTWRNAKFPFEPNPNLAQLSSGGTRYFLGANEIRNPLKDSDPLSRYAQAVSTQVDGSGVVALFMVAEQRSLAELLATSERPDTGDQRATHIRWLLDSVEPSEWHVESRDWISDKKGLIDSALVGTIHAVRLEPPQHNTSGASYALSLLMAEINQMNRALKSSEGTKPTNELLEERIKARERGAVICEQARTLLSSLSVHCCQFTVLRDGECRLDMPNSFDEFKHSIGFAKLSYNLITSYLHVHQHHDGTSPICRLYFDCGPEKFRDRTIFDLYRHVSELEKTEAIDHLNDALGVLAYATTFRFIRGKDKENQVDAHTPTVGFVEQQDTSLRASLSQRRDQLRKELERKKQHIAYLEVMMTILWTGMYPTVLWGLNLLEGNHNGSCRACNQGEKMVTWLTSVILGNFPLLLLLFLISIWLVVRVRSNLKRYYQRGFSRSRRTRYPRQTAFREYAANNWSRLVAAYFAGVAWFVIVGMIFLHDAELVYKAIFGLAPFYLALGWEIWLKLIDIRNTSLRD